MASYYIPMTAPRVPDNAMLDTSGLNSGIAAIGERNRYDQETATNNARYAEQNSRAKETHGAAMEDRANKAAAKVGAAILGLPPEQQQMAWAKTVQSHPKLADSLTKNGINPRDHAAGAKFFVDMDRGYQAPPTPMVQADIDYKRAQTAKLWRGDEAGEQTAEVRNYRFSQSQGFPGTFDEWRQKNRPDGIPNALQTEAARADQAQKTLSSELDEYEKLIAGTVDGQPVFGSDGRPVSGSGVTYMPGVESDQVQQKRRNIQLQMKELYNLGVLNGPDLQLMDTMLFDPGGVTSIIDTSGRAQASVAGVKSMMRRLRDDKVNTFSRPSVGPQAMQPRADAQGGQGQIPPGAVRLLQGSAQDPGVIQQFEAKYGPGSARQFLQGQ